MLIDQSDIDFIKSKFPMPDTDIQTAYDAGYECGLNGATLQNCHFTLFPTIDHAKAWSEGKETAENGQPNKYTQSR